MAIAAGSITICLQMCGCATHHFTLPVEITSDPPGAEIWSVPEPYQHHDYLLYVPTSGKVVNSRTATRIGTTPYKAELDVDSPHARKWHLQGRNFALELIHLKGSVVWPIPAIASIISGEFSVRCNLKYPDGTSQEINERVSHYGGANILFLAPPDALTMAARRLPRDGIKLHFVAPARRDPEGNSTISTVTNPEEKTQARVAARLQELKKLRDDKLITEDEYEAKRKQLVESL